ncbi:MAG: branched-chain amino acid transaminase [Leptospirales bacterium]
MSEPKENICYFKGEYTALKNANINIQTHALQYGTACFGGIRGYWNEEHNNIYIFRIEDHYRRLKESASILCMEFPYSLEKFTGIIKNILGKSEWKQNIYLRPVIYKSDLDISPRLHNVGDSFFVYAIALDDYLDTQKGLNVCVSSWVRIHETQIPTRAKASGGYINSALAKSEAMQQGYDEAILFDINGNISEGSASNIFFVRNGTLHTPDLSSSILEGITRRTIMELARELGVDVVERNVSRSELYTADEVFFAGTGVQVAWIKNIDNRQIGDGQIGPLTKKLQSLFFEIVKGQKEEYNRWLTPVYDKK